MLRLTKYQPLSIPQIMNNCNDCVFWNFLQNIIIYLHVDTVLASHKDIANVSLTFYVLFCSLGQKAFDWLTQSSMDASLDATASLSDSSALMFTVGKTTPRPVKPKRSMPSGASGSRNQATEKIGESDSCVTGRTGSTPSLRTPSTSAKLTKCYTFTTFKTQLTIRSNIYQQRYTYMFIVLHARLLGILRISSGKLRLPKIYNTTVATTLIHHTYICQLNTRICFVMYAGYTYM